MQLWDGVVCAASAQAGARILLTEDMQDGWIVDGPRLMNPFAAANVEPIDDLLAG
jgi:predicted nucleic acid-binding protein